MPNKNGKSLANRLASLANRQHEERMWKKNRKSLNPSLAHIKTHKEYNEWITSPEGQASLKPREEPVYQNVKGNNAMTKKNIKKNCGPKPPQFIGTKKNPAFNNWKSCSASAAGGRRKNTTRRRK